MSEGRSTEIPDAVRSDSSNKLLPKDVVISQLKIILNNFKFYTETNKKNQGDLLEHIYKIYETHKKYQTENKSIIQDDLHRAIIEHIIATKQSIPDEPSQLEKEIYRIKKQAEDKLQEIIGLALIEKLEFELTSEDLNNFKKIKDLYIIELIKIKQFENNDHIRFVTAKAKGALEYTANIATTVLGRIQTIREDNSFISSLINVFQYTYQNVSNFGFRDRFFGMYQTSCQTIKQFVGLEYLEMEKGIQNLLKKEISVFLKMVIIKQDFYQEKYKPILDVIDNPILRDKLEDTLLDLFTERAYKSGEITDFKKIIENANEQASKEFEPIEKCIKDIQIACTLSKVYSFRISPLDKQIKIIDCFFKILAEKDVELDYNRKLVLSKLFQAISINAIISNKMELVEEKLFSSRKTSSIKSPMNYLRQHMESILTSKQLLKTAWMSDLLITTLGGTKEPKEIDNVIELKTIDKMKENIFGKYLSPLYFYIFYNIQESFNDIYKNPLGKTITNRLVRTTVLAIGIAAVSAAIVNAAPVVINSSSIPVFISVSIAAFSGTILVANKFSKFFTKVLGVNKFKPIHHAIIKLNINADEVIKFLSEKINMVESMLDNNKYPDIRCKNFLSELQKDLYKMLELIQQGDTDGFRKLWSNPNAVSDPKNHLKTKLYQLEVYNSQINLWGNLYDKKNDLENSYLYRMSEELLDSFLNKQINQKQKLAVQVKKTQNRESKFFSLVEEISKNQDASLEKLLKIDNIILANLTSVEELAKVEQLQQSHTFGTLHASIHFSNNNVGENNTSKEHESELNDNNHARPIRTTF